MANDETTGLLARAERNAWQLAASRLLDLSNRYAVPAEVYAAALDAVRLFGKACEAAAEARGVAKERARCLREAQFVADLVGDTARAMVLDVRDRIKYPLATTPPATGAREDPNG
jgi:hypothetical protein